MAYNWQLKNWPNFKFDVATLNDDALHFSKSIGEITGVSEGLAGSDQIDALVRLMIEEAMKTSAIEGEILNRQDVMSSIKNNLGLNKKPANVKDKKAKAVADLMIAVRNNYNKKLSTHLIKEWHKILFGESKTAHAGAKSPCRWYREKWAKKWCIMKHLHLHT